MILRESVTILVNEVSEPVVLQGMRASVSAALMNEEFSTKLMVWNFTKNEHYFQTIDEAAVQKSTQRILTRTQGK